ncbi:MAG: hypothetical protein ACPG7F_18660 [Aggregatilineales bacterium]
MTDQPEPTHNILSRRRWMLKAHGQHIVVVKGTRERFVHPLMKALIWALYLPEYPGSTIEVRIGDKYKPDIVAFSEGDIHTVQDAPLFWGEAGRVGKDKIESLARRFPDTHFAIGKWNRTLYGQENIVKRALKKSRRTAPFDLIRFPAHSADFIDDDGNITITHDDVEWVRIE